MSGVGTADVMIGGRAIATIGTGEVRMKLLAERLRRMNEIVGTPRARDAPLR